MPATYAHYKLGQEILREAPSTVKEVIDAYPELFQIGLHGPDLLFYHKPLTSNPVMKLGYDIHTRPGRTFFEHAREVLKEHPGQPEYLSYTYGVICHFVLDAVCHGYVEEKSALSGVSHYEIESEFDRELMIRDGLDPVRHPLTGHLVASEANAAVIKDFYQITAEEALHAIKGTVFYHKLLLSPSRIKRSILFWGLALTGHRDMQDLFINYDSNTLCFDSTNRLLQLFTKGAGLTLKLLAEFSDFLENDGPLDDLYGYTFDGTPSLE